MPTRLRRLVGLAAIAASLIACSSTDAAIATQVKNRLASDERTKNAQIAVTAANKVVTLTGTVESATAKSKAVELARATDGVSNVVDKLALTTATAQSGGALPSATG